MCLLAVPASAQTATLRGQVKDESGAVIPGAKVSLAGPSGPSRTVATANDGSYVFTDIVPGDYIARASAPSMVLREPVRLTLTASQQVVDLMLNVAVEEQEVTVDESGRPIVSTDAAANASAVVLRGADLDALADNPNDLAADLRALAGPAAGPNIGQVLIDGFSGGNCRPRTSIREIRINQNPFSAEYDRLGYGRIEIFTKPGTDKLRGDLGYNFATDKLNSRNPYAGQKAPFHLHELREALSGPLSKKASFNLNFVREWVDNGNVVNGVVRDPQSLTPTAFTGVPLSTLRRTAITPRVDYQLSTNHTLTIRYSYSRDAVNNAGVGGFSLVDRG